MKAINAITLFAMLALALSVSAKPSQSQAQDFVVTLNDSPNGLIIDVDERDSGERLFSTITDAIALNGDANNGRKVALSVTSQNSGPKQPIASSVFLIVNDKLFDDHTYIARVHRARFEEIKPATPDEAKQLNEMATSEEQVRLAQLYQEGRGVPQDYRKASELYEKAAARGNALAQVNLGWLYHEGKGVPQDYHKAAELYQKSANQGNAAGQAYLASSYAEGKGVTKDYQKAVELFHKAVNQGQSANTFNDFAWFLATCPDDAWRNGKEAVRYATKACETTEWKSRNFVGTLAAAYAELGDLIKRSSFKSKQSN
jgi:TPR repeat protein